MAGNDDKQSAEGDGVGAGVIDVEIVDFSAERGVVAVGKADGSAGGEHAREAGVAPIQVGMYIPAAHEV